MIQRRFVVPFAAVGAACLVHWALGPFLQGASFTLYTVAVLLTALRAGAGPAMLATALSLAKIVWFDLEPVHSFALVHRRDGARLLIFVALCALTAWVAARARASEAELRSTLARSERLRQRHEDVVSVVSHDLRNPLAVILLNATVMKRRIAAFERERLCQRMDRLIDDLIRLARIEAGALSLKREPIGLGELLGRTVDARAAAARRAGLRLELTLPDPAGVAEVDVPGMRRVIDILLDNAIRHTPRGGRVRLAAEVHAGGLRLEVADTGTGIPPDHLIRLFDRSWLARSSRPGRGVGLLVVKGMIEAHGGNLFVDSQPGRGAHFICLVPRRRMARVA